MELRSVIEVMGCRSTKYGGLERFILKLIKENSLRKFYIIYDEKPWSKDYLEVLESLGATVLIINTRKISLITNLLKFYTLLREVNPEIVHFHFGYAFSIWGPICKLMKIKRLYKTVHECFFYDNTQIYDISKTGFPHRIITWNGNIYKIFDNVFCVSHFVKNQFDQVYKHTENTKVVYLGTPSPKFISDAQKLKLKSELGIHSQFVILTVLFANPIKGCDIFVNALSKIKHKEFIAIIVGMDENEPYTIEVKNNAKELGVDTNIRWIGITDDVYKYMNISNVYVQSSRTEALSLAAVEALSFSVPVVATNTGGLPEVTTELFPNEDYKRLSEILDYLIVNTDYRVSLSEQSYKRWHEFFRLEKGVKNYTEYYNM